jgi:hypothetical protein
MGKLACGMSYLAYDIRALEEARHMESFCRVMISILKKKLSIELCLLSVESYLLIVPWRAIWLQVISE